MLKKLILSEYFGKNFDEFISLKKYISIMKTGKSAKKSSIIAKLIVLFAVYRKDFSVIVAKKVMLDHEKTTFAAIVKAFNKLQSLTGYDWKKYWTVAKSAKNPNITNTHTGQVFRFVSYDRPESLAGLETESEKLFFQFLWFEEPMQISDKRMSWKEQQKVQEQEAKEFDIMVSSAFRGKLPPGAHREIAFSFNDWSKGDHWLIQRYIKPFIKENNDVLDAKGKQVYYDPNYQDGKGILVMVASGGVNEFNDDGYLKFIKDIKTTDYEFYKSIWLGTASAIVGNAYGLTNIRQINRTVKTTYPDIKQFSFGIDYSSTKDFTTIYLIGTNDNGEVHIIDGFDYHRGKEKNPLTEPDLIKLIWKKILMWKEKYNFSTTEYKTHVKVDSRDAVVRSYLQKYWQSASPAVRYDIKMPSAAAKFRSASSWIRIMAFRYLMGSGKLFIAPHLTGLMEEIKSREIFKDGTIKDGGDDRIQACEYAISWKLEKILPKRVYYNLLNAYKEMKMEEQDE